jgi:membrane protease YdiL (CAAX protease family)
VKDATTIWDPFLSRCGCDRFPAFFRDRSFVLALLAGAAFWLILWFLVPVDPLPWTLIWSLPFLSVVLWQPLIEELLFRGLLQGQLLRVSWGSRSLGGITSANGITSLLFMVAHWYGHSPVWAISVVVPSLLFGFMRDRFHSTYPAMALHSFYNAGYFLLTGGSSLALS